MAWKSRRSLFSGDTVGQVVQKSVWSSLGRVSPAVRERTGLNRLLRSHSTCKIYLREVILDHQGLPWADPAPKEAGGAQAGAVQSPPRHLRPAGLSSLAGTACLCAQPQPGMPCCLSKKIQCPAMAIKAWKGAITEGFICWLPLLSEELANQRKCSKGSELCNHWFLCSGWSLY